jgi:hypothetical protein
MLDAKSKFGFEHWADQLNGFPYHLVRSRTVKAKIAHSCLGGEGFQEKPGRYLTTE